MAYFRPRGILHPLYSNKLFKKFTGHVFLCLHDRTHRHAIIGNVYFGAAHYPLPGATQREHTLVTALTGRQFENHLPTRKSQLN